MTVPAPIDRAALVARHCPESRGFDPYAAFSVGNGEFAFTPDATGLQTFPELYAARFPLGTAAHWGWHSFPLPDGLYPAAIRATPYDAHGRTVGYVTDRAGQEELFDWLRQNPHRLHLGRLGFDLRRRDGSPAAPEDIADIRQRLDLWAGHLHSRFTLDGEPVDVLTCCHPHWDLVAVRVESPLISAGRLRIVVAFPYGSPGIDMADWDSPDRHSSRLASHAPAARRARIDRQLDADRYHVHLAWADGAALKQTDAHRFALSGSGNVLKLSCHFSPTPLEAGMALPTVGDTASASAAHWQRFWSTGGALDLSDCTDPRAPELERRVVLSQYNTALHSAGSLPPAETGLLCNSWYGKFHLEMHWWHGAHFAAWGRFPLLARSLGYYARILPEAQALAERQGYSGARWPKMVGPDGKDAPSPVGPLLIWQQPHPLYYAELAYRDAPTPETLERWREIVFEGAAFMASYAVWDGGRYVLGPPLKSVSENTDARATTNPTFELAYWRFGLRVAQTWRERLGLPRHPEWDRVLSGLAAPAIHEGVYLLQEGMTDTYTRWNWEHPAVLGAYGMQPGDGIDPEIMRRTVRRVMESWQWDRKTWGWDPPMAAMAAARSGEPDLALDALLLDIPQNRYAVNGHVPQRADLPAYLPANGGLLMAVALMAAGWEGALPGVAHPGFPRDHSRWSPRGEGLSLVL